MGAAVLLGFARVSVLEDAVLVGQVPGWTANKVVVGFNVLLLAEKNLCRSGGFSMKVRGRFVILPECV